MLLAVDLGGTFAKLALVDSEWGLMERQEVSVAFDGYRTPLIDTVENALRAVLKKAGTAVEGIAVSATGQIDTSRGTVVGTNGCIPGYEGTEIQARLEHAFRMPVRVINDANAALLGEMTAGAARETLDVVMVTLGTGVGGAFAVNGRIVSGTHGLAGEIGHMTLTPDGETCPCGGAAAMNATPLPALCFAGRRLSLDCTWTENRCLRWPARAMPRHYRS